MNRPRDRAVELLQHYFALASGAVGLTPDSADEIEEIVDCIIGAAIAQWERRREAELA